MRGIDQHDIGPLRPTAKQVIDQMEYSTDASAQAKYSGTGVTISKQAVSGTLVQEGSFSLKAVTDATANRSFERSLVLNLSAYQNLLLWERSSQAADTFQFYVEDGSGNQSYWDITSNASADTWQQDELDLTTPDDNNGTDADLSDIVAYGYRELTASKTYYFDTIKATVGMTVAVRGTSLGDYYRHVSLGTQPVTVDAQAAPTLVAPSSNPRIDILVAHSTGTVSFYSGTEASSPSAPWASVPANVVPIAEVYLKPTMTSVLDYEDKDTDTDQGYILSDVRPFLKLGVTSFLGLTDTPSSYTANKYLKVNAGGTAIELADVSQTFLGLTDTPSSYTSQAGKLPRVNTGETALEFVTVDGAGAVDKTSAQTVAGVKTFSSFPVTPSSAPSSDYQVANKKYADDLVSGLFSGAVAIASQSSISVTSSYTIKTFNTQDYDSDAMFTPSDSKIYAKSAGVYLAVANHQGDFNKLVGVKIIKNGTTTLAQAVGGAGNTTSGGVTCSAVVQMAVDDYVEASMIMESSGSGPGSFALIKIY